jgi:hypothetical protein
MPLMGQAFLALYNDFDPARDDEYNRWHSREHVPERLTVPGILRARRYVSRADARYPYFTLYEMASAETMRSQPYLHLMDHPTPWSARMRPGFREFRRMPCGSLASCGSAIGGHVAVLVFEMEAGIADEGAWRAACDSLARRDGVVAAHAGLQDPSLRGPSVAAAQALSDTPTAVLVVEAQEARWLERHRAALMAPPELPGARCTEWRDYALMEVVLEGRTPG